MVRKSSKRPVTMKDVAELAGVSQTTVSFVINNVSDANISEETYNRVMAAIQESGYRPNALARGLRAQRTQTIGFISDHVATAPFAGHVIEGAQTTGWANGILLFLVNTGGNEAIETAAVDMLLERQVDSILYATMYHRVADPPAALAEGPAVLINCYVEDRSLPSVVPDEIEGGRTATEYLLRKGHRRIAFINNIDPIPATFGRLEGYREALAAHGVPFDESLILHEGSTAEGGYRGTLALMAQPDRPTALFCFNDRMAMGAYEALRQLGLAIPEDVAVMGFDNQEVIAAHLYPPLTTIQLPHYQMGEWAINYLIDSADKSATGTVVQHTLHCPVVERSSI